MSKKKEGNASLMRQILDEHVTFYTDKDNASDIYVEYAHHNGARALEPVSSTMFEAFLGYMYRELSGELIDPDFSEVLAIRVQNTRYTQANAVRLYRRIAGKLSGKSIAYFLADKDWTTVMVTAQGIRSGQSRKLKFLKDALDEAQVTPDFQGADLKRLLRRYVNMDDDSYLLFMIYLVQSFSRSSSHFAAIISSDKGTGKSTLTKIIRAIVDPSVAGVPILPSNEGDLKTLLGNSYLVCFDNTAALSTKFSNILCAAITGTKEAKRKLYTNCDQVILNLHNMVVINGIDIVPFKSDLSERSLLFELQTIPSERRVTDDAFFSSFERDRPAILGAIFETLSKAMQLLPEVKTDGLHRMADANREMLAIALALGITEERLQQLLEDNGKKLRAAYVENNPFVSFVASYVKTHGSMDAPGAEVYGKVLNSIPGNSKFFPDSPSAFSRRLREDSEMLREAGVQFSTHKRAEANYIRLERIIKNKPKKKEPNLLEDASTEK